MLAVLGLESQVPPGRSEPREKGFKPFTFFMGSFKHGRRLWKRFLKVAAE